MDTLQKKWFVVFRFYSQVLSKCRKCHFRDPKFKTFLAETTQHMSSLNGGPHFWGPHFWGPHLPLLVARLWILSSLRCPKPQTCVALPICGRTIACSWTSFEHNRAACLHVQFSPRPRLLTARLTAIIWDQCSQLWSWQPKTLFCELSIGILNPSTTCLDWTW